MFCNSDVMNSKVSKSLERDKGWPREVRLGRVSIAVYRRQTPNGRLGFTLANYAAGKRRFDSYATQSAAIDAARNLARKISNKDVVSASVTYTQRQ